MNGDLKAVAAAAKRENDGEGLYRGHGNGDHEDDGSGGGDPSRRGGARTGGFLMSWVLGRPAAVGTLDGRGQVLTLRAVYAIIGCDARCSHYKLVYEVVI